MAVADLSLTSMEEAEQRVVAVPPRIAVPATEPAESKLRMNGSTRISTGAQQAVAQYTFITGAVPTNGNGAVNGIANGNGTQLALEQAKAKQQALELLQAKAELSKRDEEIKALRSQAAEQEVRLRSARADLMEAKALTAEKESKIMELYRVMADASTEKAQLREELAKTQMELVETRGDLESLADEILSVKDLVLDDAELAELEASLMVAEEEGAAASTAFAATTADLVQPSAEARSLQQRAGSGASAQIEESIAVAVEAAEATWNALQNLAGLSRAVLSDAALDEEAYTGAGILKMFQQQHDTTKHQQQRQQQK